MHYGASYDQQDEHGNTWLFYAATKLNINDLQILITINPNTGRSYADPNISNNAGFTPLLALAQTGRTALIAALQALWGADQARTIDPELARVRIAQLLIQAGADVNACDKSGMSVIAHALSCPPAELPTNLS